MSKESYLSHNVWELGFLYHLHTRSHVWRLLTCIFIESYHVLSFKPFSRVLQWDRLIYYIYKKQIMYSWLLLRLRRRTKLRYCFAYKIWSEQNNHRAFFFMQYKLLSKLIWEYILYPTSNYLYFMYCLLYKANFSLGIADELRIEINSIDATCWNLSRAW